MRRSRESFAEFSVARDAYNERKSRYNASLRLLYTNWVSDALGLRAGQLFTLGELNVIFPTAEKIGAQVYARPEFPFAIYNPPEYYGPNLDSITVDQIKCGYGKPMSTLYPLENPVEADYNVFLKTQSDDDLDAWVT